MIFKKKNKKTSNLNANDQPLVMHLIELRDRLLRIVMTVMVVFLCLFPFANDLYTFLAAPLLAHMPDGGSMIATEVASPFLTPFKLTLVLSIFVSMPMLLFQMWAFIAPGLYQHERRMMFPLMFSSTFLFYAGATFAYFVVFPLVFGFFTSVVPEGVAVMTDIARYLDFVLKMFFAFGLAFEVPIVTIVLVWAGVTTPEKLSGARPYIVVAAFVIAMLLTPPDVISQTLLAVPMLFLFELGLFFSKLFVKNKKEREKAEEEELSEELKTQPAAENENAENPDVTEFVHDDIDIEQAFDEAEAQLDALDKPTPKD